MSRIRTYSELCTLVTFEERFEYLRVKAPIGAMTFGGNRYACQEFYHSKIWLHKCRDIIIRDNCCDLGLEGYEIERIPGDKSRDDIVIVHHMNPITVEQILKHDPDILKDEYLITTRFRTHNALHYGADGVVPLMKLTVRTPNDTAIWK